jgi:hypothetical protein
MNPQSIALGRYYLNHHPRKLPEMKDGVHLSQPQRSFRLEWENDLLKSLHYSGEWGQYEQVFLEAIADLCQNQPIKRLELLTLREIFHYLKLSPKDQLFSDRADSLVEKSWGELLIMLKDHIIEASEGEAFPFHELGAWEKLTFTERISWIKRYFLSKELLRFRREGGKIELLDLEESTLYIHFYEGNVSKDAFLDWLGMKMAEDFKCPRLNIVPE